MSVVKRYYVRKKEIDNNRMIDGRIGSPSELLDIKQYIEQVIDEHLTIDDGIISSLAGLEITAVEDLTISGGTALTLSLALGDIGINASDGNVITAASLAITSTATAGDATLASTNGDVVLNAGNDIILTPTANLTFALAAIPTHADDTAAGVAGLTAGQVYKTAAGSLFIKL
jgi:hypothetical protein